MQFFVLLRLVRINKVKIVKISAWKSTNYYENNINVNTIDKNTSQITKNITTGLETRWYIQKTKHAPYRNKKLK